MTHYSEPFLINITGQEFIRNGSRHKSLEVFRSELENVVKIAIAKVITDEDFDETNCQWGE